MSPDSGDSAQTLPLATERFESGQSVLVAGPALTGKRRILFSLLGETRDRSVILVTTKRQAGAFRQELVGNVQSDEEWDIRTVDCVSKRSGLQGDEESAEIAYVNSPGDLTGVGIAVSGFMQEFHEAHRDARLGLHSLSTLLMYTDLQRVFRFCHVLTGRIQASEFGGVFTLDTTHGSDVVETLQGLFDVLVQVQEGEEGPKLRVRGRDLGPRHWTTF